MSCQWIDDGERLLQARPHVFCTGELSNAVAALRRQVLVACLLCLGRLIARVDLVVQGLPVEPVSHGCELKFGIESPEGRLRAGADFEADGAVKIIQHRRVARRQRRPAGGQEILQAAGLAAEIQFRVVGSGQLEHQLGAAPANVEHVPWVEYEHLPGELRTAGCALGIFGTTGKAGRVIPNKAFQALASGTPLITADTPAARELLVDGDSALLVPAGDPAALAEAIRRLAASRELAEQIASGGRTAYERQASEAVLGRRWREIIERLV